MTLDQFYVELAKTRGQWEIINGREVRHKTKKDVVTHKCLCPLHVVAGINRFNTSDAMAALGHGFTAADVFIPSDNIKAVVFGTDAIKKSRLLQAVGLQEDGTPLAEVAPTKRTRSVAKPLKLTDFFNYLKESPRRWVVKPAGDIEYKPLRPKGAIGNYDPITYVFMKARKKSLHMAQYEQAAKALGLGHLAHDLMMAADHTPRLMTSNNQKALRELMVEACGVKEVA